MKKDFYFIKPLVLGSIVFVFLIIPIIILFFQDLVQMEKFTREDGIIEYLSAFFYFLTSFICFFIFFKQPLKKINTFQLTRRNYFFLLIGLIFFFCFGEEISWGQRIIGFNSSTWFISHNLQDETNLHNLHFFSSVNKDNIGKVQIGIKQWISPEGILILFWLFYCLIIPIFNAISQKVSNFIKIINFPLIPIWIGILFALNQSTYEVLKIMQLLPVHPLAEVKETNTAFLFLITSISLYADYIYNQLDNRKQ